MKKNLLEKLNGKRNMFAAIALLTAALAVTGCSAEDVSNILNQTVTEQSDTSAVEGNGDNNNDTVNGQNAEGAVSGDNNSSESAQSGSDSSESYMANGSTTASSSSLIDTSNLFSDRDLEQEADLTDAE